MRTIWKFQINVNDNFILDLPRGTKILSVQIQNMSGQFCIWALVDPSQDRERRVFRIYGTGHLIQEIESLEYVATIQDGPFVWHIFEVKIAKS